ncbi:2-dehydro-3-deoxygalactonokinase [Reyranella sp.]|uniref:2-dehydro-3-deoxygalactonokinase n=1 Tax=Reyranella sp. TaxID=1929291 RepID=UPI00272FEA7A|nr:2-dehydro-3-deoxygalactonokinase [Reyranella sp.]MDP2377594.1 2-dehydro-3-deoxygalactonokinase [Reyranella sp.]
MPHLIAVDWGTSSLRGARLDETGRVLGEKSTPLGILNVPNGDFAGVFASLFSDWMTPAGTVCLISGMAGSRQGWVEAPYVACPAGPDELRRHLHWIEPGRIAIVPGLSDEQDEVPDVMRGEEVQIFGAMRLAGLAEGLFVLPGTHSKWATVRGGRVTGFRTCMTGEFYGLLSQHSILARTLEADATLDEAVFLRGVTRAGNGQGLLHNAFGVRALALFGRLSPAQSASYLSGLLVGEELRLQELPAGREVIAIGTPALTARYALALGQMGARVRTFGAEATWAGLRALHTTSS